MQNLVKTIQKLRKERHLSQLELAYFLEISSQSKISYWESRNNVPDIFEAQKIAIFGDFSGKLLKRGFVVFTN